MELVGRNVRASWPAERLAAHGCADHLYRHVGRALERGATAEVDDVGAALDDALLQCRPFFSGKFRGTDQVCQWGAVHLSCGCENGHLLTVSTECAAACYGALRQFEIFGQLALQAGRVEGGQGGHLRGLQTGVDQGDEARDVSGVEDDDYVLAIGAVSLDVFAQLLGHLRVALEEVFARHAGLASGTARGDYILGVLQRFSGIGRVREVHSLKTAVAHLFIHALQRWFIHVLQADVGRQAHHRRSLCHVGADHATGTNDCQFFVRQKFHRIYRLGE